MHKIKYIGIVLLSMLMIGCPDGSDDNNDNGGVPDGRNFTQTVNVAAEASQKTVTLTNLNAAISNIRQSASWVVATKKAYTSGSPSILLEISENTSNQERTTNITITDISNNTLILTVKQVKAGETPIDSGMDALHNQSSDQPAFSRLSD